jgi:CBS domain-containing protein
MKTGDACKRNAVVVKRHTPIPVAAKLMRHNHVGSLVVVDDLDDRVPVGIVTDRDIVVEIVAADLDPRTMTVGEIMGDSLVTAADEDDSLDTLRLMRLSGVRRVPVVTDRGLLVGIATLDDLLGALAGEFDSVVGVIENEQSRESLVRR